MKSDLEKNNCLTINESKLLQANYRPFIKRHLYYDKSLIERPGIFNSIFPENSSMIYNVAIGVSGEIRKDFTVLIVDRISDLEVVGRTQYFPLYFYEENANQQKSIFDDPNDSEYIRRDGVSDFILNRAQKQYGKNITKEDIFYYVYGFLHSPDYRTTFANDLKKMLPRLPLVDDVRDFWKFSKAGRQLAELHIEYENVPPYPDVKVTGEDSGYFKVQKMRFPKKGQKDTIIFNSKITVSNIPDKAYEYVVNGKSAIEWIMERYQVTVDKISQIKNDPNDWADEAGNPRYILDLLLSIINVSVQTVDIVNQLPKLNFT